MIKKESKKEEVPQSFEEHAQDVEAQASGELATLKKQLEEAQAKAAENWEQLLRKEAEMQNIRRRSETDVSNARKYGVERLVEELIAVVDSFEQALNIKPEDADAYKAMHEGMELTYKVLLTVLEKHGVKLINPVDEMFDPNFHEAIMMQPSADHKPNQIMTVVQKGVLVHDRVLRPARVIVVKGE